MTRRVDRHNMAVSHFIQWTVYPTGTLRPMDTSSNKDTLSNEIIQWTLCLLDEVSLCECVSLDEVPIG
uniref:Uncharacterized protein n=1 Tax=Acrobeloides nanus TaxID=290746 RepID=A0A914EIW8_9BILA